MWITVGDIILLSLREFQDDKADVIHRYTPDEARNLKTYGELKSDFQINEGGEEGGVSDDEGGVEFEEAEIDDLCECQQGLLADGPESFALCYTFISALFFPVVENCTLSCMVGRLHSPDSSESSRGWRRCIASEHGSCVGVLY